MSRDAERNQLRQIERGTNSSRYNPRTLLDFDGDDFNWRSPATDGNLALKLAPKPMQTAMPPQALLGLVPKAKPAPTKRRAQVAAITPPCVALALYVEPVKLPPILTSIQHSMTAGTMDDFDAFLLGCKVRATLNRTQKAALLAA